MNAKYQEFWGLTQPLFISQTNEHDLYISTRWRQVTDHVLAYLETKGEIFVLDGPQGCGKSTYLKWLRQQVPPTSHQFILRSPIQTIAKPGWFLRSIVSEFPKEAFVKKSNSHPQFQDQVINMLETFLDQTSGITFIIDHAQAISEEALTEVETFSQAARLANLNINFLLVMTKIDHSKPGMAISTAKAIDFPVWSEDEFCEYVHQRLQSHKIPQVPAKGLLHDIFQDIAGNISRGNFLLEDLLIQAFHHKERSFELEATRISGLPSQSTINESMLDNQSQTRPRQAPNTVPSEQSEIHTKIQDINKRLPPQHANTEAQDSTKSTEHTQAKTNKPRNQSRERGEVASGFDKPKLKPQEREKLPIKEAASQKTKGAKEVQAEKKEEQINPETLSDLFDN